MTRQTPSSSHPTPPSMLAPAAASRCTCEAPVCAASCRRAGPTPPPLAGARRVAKMAKEKKAKELKDKKEQQARLPAPDGCVAALASEHCTRLGPLCPSPPLSLPHF